MHPMTQPTNQTSSEFEARSYFPTPVAVLDLPESDRLNGVLGPMILDREKSQPSVDHSNLGGWQSTDDFQDWGGDAGAELLGHATALASHLTADRDGKPVEIKWRVNSWANINRQGHGNEFHTHPGCFWSGCYYVDDGGADADRSLGGEFEIKDPRGVAPAMYAPNLCYSLPGCQSLGASELIFPRAGAMLLFPSWLSHAVRPYLGGGNRISVAFNLSL